MTPELPGRKNGRAAWLALAAVLAGGSAALSLALALAGGSAADGANISAALDWQPGLGWREPWRAWSAAWLHFSELHLAANLAGCALVALLGVVARLPARMAAAWFVAWPLTQFGLLARPDLLHYGGLSGVLHAGVAVAALHLVVAARGTRRLVGAAMLIGLAAKVLSEAPWGDTLRRPPGWDIAIAPVAHACGLVAGLVAAGAIEWARRGRTIARRA